MIGIYDSKFNYSFNFGTIIKLFGYFHLVGDPKIVSQYLHFESLIKI